MVAVLVAGGVLLALLALLAVPVDLAFRLEGAGPLGGEVAVRWLFGLVRARIPVPGARRAPARPEAAPEAAGPGTARAGRTRLLGLARDPAFRRRAWRLAGDLLRAVRVRHLRLRLRLGLGDPADTGRLWAVLGPLGAMARGLRRAEVRLEPEFGGEALELRADGRVRLVPLRLLALVAAFALSPPALRAWRAARGGHG
jgi:hypothetical protein